MERNKLENITRKFLSESGFHSGEVSFQDDDSVNIVWCVLENPDNILFPRSWSEDVLSSLNHLLRKAIEKELALTEEALREMPIIIDAFALGKKRVDQVKTTAHMMAERARFFKSSVEMPPMPPFERKIVHAFLGSASDLATKSDGTGRDRHVVIKYDNKEI